MRSRAMFVRADDGTRLRLLGSTVTVKATTADTAGATEWVVIESERGSDVGAHRHPWGEAYYILDGVLEVQIGARTHRVTAGDFLAIPARAVHGFQVLSDFARFLHVSTGGGAVDAFCDLAKVLSEATHPDDSQMLAAFDDLNTRHGLVFLAPAPV